MTKAERKQTKAERKHELFMQSIKSAAPVLLVNNGLLLDKDGESVRKGEVIADFRGDMAVVVGGRPPHKPGSSGFVHARYMTDEGLSGECEYYATVYGLKWKEL